MRLSLDAIALPFDEAIEFFREKVNLPTQTWRDLWERMHSRAFVVAGAMKAELLSDLRYAVDKAISEGTTLSESRKNNDRSTSAKSSSPMEICGLEFC